jgi:hypothetical protein
VSVDVAWRRERHRGISREIFEKVGKMLKRNGGDDGVRTRDLRRDRPNVSKILGLYAPAFKGLAGGAAGPIS